MRFFLTFLLIWGYLSVDSQTIYVKQGGTGNGSSWAQAAGDLKLALSNAPPGSSVWVASGVYKPTTCNNCTDAHRLASFEVPPSVKLYGGFAGTETHIDERDLQPDHYSVLSGDINSDGDFNDNSYSVVQVGQLLGEIIIDGFIITHGSADDSTASPGNARSSGGGLFVRSNTPVAGSLVVRYSLLVNNRAHNKGGGLYFEGQQDVVVNLTLHRVKFGDNIADYGGGVSVSGGAPAAQVALDWQELSFENNTAGYGAGMALLFGNGAVVSGNVKNCIAFGNTAVFNGGGAYVHAAQSGVSDVKWQNCQFDDNTAQVGAAVFQDVSYSGQSFDRWTRCSFTANQSIHEGGALYRSAYLNGLDSASFSFCDFVANHSMFAGAAVFHNGISGTCVPVYAQCRFLNNSTDTYGGAVYNLGKSGVCNPKFYNCLFAHNKAFSCGAIYNLGSENGQSNPIISNCTFFKNHADLAGGAIYANANAPGSGQSSPLITNCVFFGNTAGDGLGQVLRNVYGSPTISYCLVDVTDCNSLNNGPGAQVTCGPGMIYQADPMFKDTQQLDLRLLAVSPARDVGLNSGISGFAFDLDSTARIFDNVVDLGCYEYKTLQPPYLLAPLTGGGEYCAGDAVALSISAGGSAPLFYQWYRNGQAVSGATQPNLYFPAVQPEDAGAYTCSVSNNGLNEVVFGPVMVNVLPLVVPTVSLANLTGPACFGQSVVIGAVTTNTGPMPQFAWSVDGQPAAGGGSTFTLNATDQSQTVGVTVQANVNCADPSVVSASLVVPSGQSVITPTMQIGYVFDTVNNQYVIQVIEAIGNAGAVYSWYVNGAWQIDDSTGQFILDNPQSSVTVHTVMQTAVACAQPDLVESNTLLLQPVGADDVPKALLSAYPNPVRGGARLLAYTDAPFDSWLLFNTLGRCVAQGRQPLAAAADLKVPLLESGVYYLIMRNGAEPIGHAMLIITSH